MTIHITSSSCAESGLLWVEPRLRENSRELGQPVDCLEWPRALDPYGDGPLTLKVCRGGRFRVVELSREDLRAVDGVPEIRQRLGETLRECRSRDATGRPW